MNTINTSLQGVNSATTQVINEINWVKTYKAIVKEYFWLKEHPVYDDSWENIIDFVSDFKDTNVLKQKKVKYVEKLWQLWVSEIEFNKLFPNWLPEKSLEEETETEKPLEEETEEEWIEEEGTEKPLEESPEEVEKGSIIINKWKKIIKQY